MGKTPNTVVLLLEIPRAFANCITIFDNMFSSTILILSMINIYCIIQRKNIEFNFACLFLIHIVRLI